MSKSFVIFRSSTVSSVSAPTAQGTDNLNAYLVLATGLESVKIDRDF